MVRREGPVGQVVEQPELFAQQEGAIEPAVLGLDVGERGELADRLMFGSLQQRPAGVLDPAAGRGVRALVGVPFVAADLVGGAGREPDDVDLVPLRELLAAHSAEGSRLAARLLRSWGPDRFQIVEPRGAAAISETAGSDRLALAR